MMCSSSERRVVASDAASGARADEKSERLTSFPPFILLAASSAAIGSVSLSCSCFSLFFVFSQV